MSKCINYDILYPNKDNAMNDFIFYSPTKFIFRRGAAALTGPELASRGFKNALLVYGGSSAISSGLIAKVKTSLIDANISFSELCGIRPNPEVTSVREGIAIARANKCDTILAVGGGSVIDAAKAIAFGTSYDGDVWDFFEGKAKIKTALPISTVLTLPAAGSEGSASCVISNDQLKAKRGIGSDLIRPQLSFLDPETTFSLPAYQTAAGVTDMIAHILERYFSGAADAPISDSIAAALIRELIKAAPIAINNPSDYESRATIMWAGTLAHNDLVGCGRSLDINSRAGGWESHALEHELSAIDPKITHGAGLAVMLPVWMSYVWREDPARFLKFGHDVFGISPQSSSHEDIEKAVLLTIDSLKAFFTSISMPKSLKEFGLDSSCVDMLLVGLEKSKGPVFGAFKKLSTQDARSIYLSAF